MRNSQRHYLLQTSEGRSAVRAIRTGTLGARAYRPRDGRIGLLLSLSIYSPELALPLSVAEKIVALFKMQYGHNYHQKVLHDPSWIVDEVSHGRWIAFVLRDEGGEVHAHAALLPGNGEYKFARTVVDPALRGQGLADLLTDARFLHLKRRQLREDIYALSTDAVTTHDHSQRVFVKRGFAPSALLLGKLVDYFRRGQRESVVTLTRLASDTHRKVYLPKDLAPLAECVYQGVKAERTLSSPSYRGFVPSVEGGNSVPMVDEMGSVSFTIGSPQELSLFLQSAIWTRAEYVAVHVDLSTPFALHATELLRRAAFLPAGIKVGEKVDYLTLQSGRDVRPSVLESLALSGTQAESLRGLLLSYF